MKIYSFDSLPSTQVWLTEMAAKREVDLPCAVIAKMQTEGVGSRRNRWIGKRGNFFASVATLQKDLPSDLPLAATSIFFAYLMKSALEEMGSKCWLKWPNDIYLKERKIGGCITAKKGDAIIAGIGVNIVDAPHGFGVLEIEASPSELLEKFLEKVENPPLWKQIFSNYSLEFEKSKNYSTHVGDETVELKGAVLQEDGSLKIGQRRVVSLR